MPGARPRTRARETRDHPRVSEVTGVDRPGRAGTERPDASDPVTVKRLDRDGRGAWEAFTASRAEAEAGHRWSFLDATETVFGVRSIRLAALRGERLVAVLPLVVQESVLGRFVTSVPYLNHAGVLGTDGEARRRLAESALEIAREGSADRLELRGRHGQDLPIDEWSGKNGYELELPSTTEELWKGLRSKVRAQVRRPQKEGYESRVVGDGGCRDFYPLLARRWHELGSPVLPRKFFTGLERAFGPDLDYVLVERDGARAAVGVIVQSGSKVEIPWAASALEHNRFGVNMFLYWTALERAVERGANRFDFGRSTPGSGNARFKLQWGAREEPLRWNAWIGSPRGRASEHGDRRRGLAAAVWRRLPETVSRWVGPVLAARIPL